MQGYLQKLNRRNVWQRKWFEVVGQYFVYYKKDGQATKDMLCAMDLTRADAPYVGPATTSPAGESLPSREFLINYDRLRRFRARTHEEAARWVQILLATQRAYHPADPAVSQRRMNPLQQAGGAAEAAPAAPGPGKAQPEPRGDKCCMIL